MKIKNYLGGLFEIVNYVRIVLLLVDLEALRDNFFYS